MSNIIDFHYNDKSYTENYFNFIYEKGAVTRQPPLKPTILASPEP
jgi:hypothetical protein